MRQEIISGVNKSSIQPPVAIYARQSIDKKDSISIETQIEDCINEYKRLSYAGPIFIFEDKGFSGKNTKRPAFQEMMNMIKNNKIHYVFAYKLDRISRNLNDFSNMQMIFQEHNVAFNSKNDSFDTSTPVGQSMLQIIMVFAELERKNTQQRVTDNYYSRIKTDGRWGGGPAPFGFKNKKINGVASLDPIPDEIEIVKFIFKTFLDTPCISLGKIVKTLNEKKYKSRNTNFTNVSVARILHNPIYVKADKKLFAYFNSIYFKDADEKNKKQYNFLNEEEKWDGKHSANIIKKRLADTRKRTKAFEHIVYITNIEGFIDSNDYIEVQNRLSSNKQIKRSNCLGKMQELTGMVKCAKCGRAIKIYNYPRLSCYGNIGLKECDAHLNPKVGISTQQAFDELRIKIGLCVTRYFVQLKKTCKHLDEKNKKAREKINSLQTEIENLLERSLTADANVQTSLDKMIATRSRQIDELSLELILNDQNEKLIKAQKNLDYFLLSPEERQMILRETIERIELNEDYTFKIVWKSKVIEDIADYDKLEYITDGKIRIKDDIADKLKGEELQDVIYDAVGIKVEAAKIYCKINNIELPDDFFELYENRDEFFNQLNILKKKFKRYKSTCDFNDEEFCQKHGATKNTEPLFGAYQFSTNNPASIQKFLDLFNMSSKVFQIKYNQTTHEANKELIRKYGIPLKKPDDMSNSGIVLTDMPEVDDILDYCIEELSAKVTNNEILTLAFSLLSPNLLDLNRNDFDKFVEKGKYLPVYRFLNM